MNLRIWLLVVACLAPAVHAGILLGGSFLAAPAKFQAPSITRQAALDVGRQTFRWQIRAEFAAVVVALAAAVLGGLALWPRLTPLLSAVAILFVQVWVLLPALDARVEAILQGGEPPPSSFHGLYVGLEVVKLGLLLAAAALAWRSAHIRLSSL